MALANINFAAGQDTMEEVFDKLNECIDRVNNIYDDGLLPNGIDTQATGIQLKFKVIEIGDWDMDTDNIKSVSHGLSLSTIRKVDVLIRNDSNDTYYPLNMSNDVTDTTPQGGVSNVTGTSVVMMRLDGGGFDLSTFNSTSFNRGWITITYAL